MNVEYTRCNLCKADNYDFLFRKQGFNIVKCKKCSLVYVNPRLTQRELVANYNANKISPVPYYKEHFEEDKQTFRKRIKIIKKYKKRGKLLDIGCSIGTFLETAKEENFEGQGIDINKQAISVAQKKGLNVKVANIEKNKISGAPFDIIVMNDLIEHVTDPVKTMKIANRLLKKKGIIFLVTPNAGSTMGKLTRKRWIHYKPDEHLSYFTPKTMSILLRKSGFSPLHIGTIGRVRNLATVIIKGSTYFGQFPQKIMKKLYLDRIFKRMRFTLSVDEIVAIARKK
ncbi:MAG: class I SAM-dependent methyltransferase [Candidatus Woesearchaeota archaeon]